MDQRKEERSTENSGLFEVRHFPCPQCGAELCYDPPKRALACEYCGYAEEIGGAPAPKHDLAEGLERERGPVEREGQVSCPKCGADYTLEPLRESTRCPYCETPAIRDPLNPLPPDGVLPFRIDEQEAHRLFARWIGSLWLAPGELSRVVDTRKKLTGWYLPYWMFDADTESRYRGERGDAYYVTVERVRMIDGRERLVREQERRIRWTPVSGRVARRFEEWPVSAERKIPRHLLEQLAPWPSREAIGMEEKAICGFETREYGIALPDGHAEARREMAARIRLDVLRDIGGDEQRIHGIDTRWSDERYNYLLLPVWSTAFRYKGKTYHYVVNGVTGVVRGERPYSWWKIAGIVAAALGLLAVAAYWEQIRAWFGG